MDIQMSSLEEKDWPCWVPTGLVRGDPRALAGQGPRLSRIWSCCSMLCRLSNDQVP